jgi:isoquinoline 1-oxidoreductase subunit beta
MAGTPVRRMIKDGIDPTSVEGAANDRLRHSQHRRRTVDDQGTGVPVLWWRVVGSSHTTFAVEAFIDEVAHAAGKDPFARSGASCSSISRA